MADSEALVARQIRLTVAEWAMVDRMAAVRNTTRALLLRSMAQRFIRWEAEHPAGAARAPRIVPPAGQSLARDTVTPRWKPGAPS